MLSMTCVLYCSREYYGTVEWSVKAVYHGYMGWFSARYPQSWACATFLAVRANASYFKAPQRHILSGHQSRTTMPILCTVPLTWKVVKSIQKKLFVLHSGKSLSKRLNYSFKIILYFISTLFETVHYFIVQCRMCSVVHVHPSSVTSNLCKGAVSLLWVLELR